MPHILQNKNLRIQVDLPHENYQLPRFDWTGKVADVKFKGMPVCTRELAEAEGEDEFGKGFYNEFGIETALGFEEAEQGDWFHKIGVGLLKKEGDAYDFSHRYEISPAQFDTQADDSALRITCTSQLINGYGYVLEKEIKLRENGFEIDYQLTNTGEKAIHTQEYCHNFLSLNHLPMGSDYRLSFPFPIQQELFEENVNPGKIVEIGEKEINFTGTPEKPFFFSYLAGQAQAEAFWKLENHQQKLGISEKGNFQTQKVNLWGQGHVISPELFVDIHLEAGQSREWSRTYEVHELD